ncbi:Uu.00g057030.m01.CDS01 [Anthostomella pinea]|uniref:Uu.00g057030.m01.CDS01 n=1 Tax=Anthostomella pinea TaxID=933095 RepID=A0AAI8VRN4_9PEZI|nr:Uu.00g057030.m01.CDS01 [Anthostomella pinea]
MEGYIAVIILYIFLVVFKFHTCPGLSRMGRLFKFSTARPFALQPQTDEPTTIISEAKGAAKSSKGFRVPGLNIPDVAKRHTLDGTGLCHAAMKNVKILSSRPNAVRLKTHGNGALVPHDFMTVAQCYTMGISICGPDEIEVRR